MEPYKFEPTPDQAMVTHVRASALGGLLGAVDARGAEVRGVLIASLSPEAQTILREPPGPFQWIEMPLVNELVATYEKRFGLDDIGRRVQHTANEQLTVIHAWLLRLLTPETLFRQASTLYRFNFRGGIAKAEAIHTGHAVVSIWSMGIYPTWYSHAFPGWLTGALSLTGASSVQVVHHPPESGYLHTYEVTWAS